LISSPLMSGPLYVKELKNELEFSRNRIRELLRQAHEMGLVTVRGESVELTPLGSDFLEAYVEEDYRRIHEILSAYYPYRVVFQLVDEGVRSLGELAERSGLSAMAADSLVRIVRKVREHSSNRGELSIRPRPLTYRDFVKELERAYRERTMRQFGSKYVKIGVLRRELWRKLGITKETFEKFFERYIRENPDRVVLGLGPIDATEGVQGLIHRGRHYSYIWIKLGRELFE